MQTLQGFTKNVRIKKLRIDVHLFSHVFAVQKLPKNCWNRKYINEARK